MKFLKAKWRYLSIAVVGCVVIVFSFQNCGKGFNSGLDEDLTSGLQDVVSSGGRYANLSTKVPEIYMPSIARSGGMVLQSNSGSAGGATSGGTTSGGTTGGSVSVYSDQNGLPGGSTSGTSGSIGGTTSGGTSGSSSGGSSTRTGSLVPVVKAMNGCGTFSSNGTHPILYPLTLSRCGNSQGQFVVYVEGGDLVEPYVCFYRADQTETSTNPAPGKCKFAGPLAKNANGTFVWTSTPFFATADIQFTDYKVEVYRDRNMNQRNGLVGSVVMGLRFPELELGQKFFTTDDLDSVPERGWMSSQGPLVFYPACGGAHRPGWTLYPYDVPGQEGPCYYKITQGQAPAAKRSCSFPGGELPGFKCVFPAVSAYDTQSKSVVATRGGVGNLSARCDDGEWKDVRINCVSREGCFFPGGQVDPSCPDHFESVRVSDGLRPEIRSITNSNRTATATCDDGVWKEIRVNCY